MYARTYVLSYDGERTCGEAACNFRTPIRSRNPPATEITSVCARFCAPIRHSLIASTRAIAITSSQVDRYGGEGEFGNQLPRASSFLSSNLVLDKRSVEYFELRR